ncbi:integral membrane protein, partial [Streptomyces pristinaespiralis ATCC 25486]
MLRERCTGNSPLRCRISGLRKGSGDMAVGASGVTVASEVDSPGGTAGAVGRPEGRRGGPAVWAGLWPFALAALPLGLLVLASWFGRHVRPSADEWCFLPVVRDDGVLGLIGKFWFTDNGRLGNGLLVGLYAEFPVAGHQWFGLVSGLVMLVLLWALVVQVLRRAGQEVPRGVPLFVAAMVCAVFLFATPNTYKTFYWPAASVSHTVAPVLACAAVLPLLCARRRAGRVAAVVSAAFAGVFAIGWLYRRTIIEKQPVAL